MVGSRFNGKRLALEDPREIEAMTDKELQRLEHDTLDELGGVMYRAALYNPTEKEPPLRQHHHVQAVLRHVDTAEREHCHLRIPSLLMRARALATVRVWKKRLEHQAHSRSDIRGGCGLPVATGAEP
jgi:hypothetical protein